MDAVVDAIVVLLQPGSNVSAVLQVGMEVDVLDEFLLALWV